MNNRKNDNPWNVLIEELDCWHSAGRQASFWWRDDDASTASRQLETLCELSSDLDIPLSIAVIPERLQGSLIDCLQDHKNIRILQHGYAHQSHATSGAKKIEIGGERTTEAISDELAQGRKTLENAFGNEFIKVLVPPWNRIEARTYPAIRESGLIGLSSMWARIQAFPVAELRQVNCHLDPVNWREDRGFIGDQKAIEAIQLHLLGRRVDILDADEPTGILTHHLDQSSEVWQFCRTLFTLLNQHPAVEWLDAKTIWSTDNI